ncbi:MAG: hypothetical protein JW804_01685 [Sedimentisphaerales bacterium]|nr:hypothetical protein [Sedimentisphaerales bacterium]
MRIKHLKMKLIIAVAAIFVASEGFFCAYAEDFVIDGVYEAALDLPRILFLLRREPNGPPLEYEGNFELNYAFLDTGASGILLSKETVEALEISLEPDAQYVDVGVGGDEYFDVSEPLYIGTLAYDDLLPYNPDRYLMNDRWQFQVTQLYAEWPMEPLDVLGMPVMAGKIAVLDPTKLATLEDYFIADILPAESNDIPPVDITVTLRYEKYIMPENPENIPPLPVLGYNPVIDNIVADYNGAASTGNWLFDTGGSVSIMSVAQGAALGLTDESGEPIIPADFTVDIGGIGGSVTLPGFQIDSLSVPTLNGYDIVFQNARICVHDIGFFDVTSGEMVILDGVFGSNFLCPSMNMNTWDISDTPFNKIVIDNVNGILGFDVKDIYPLPQCGDANHPQPVGDLTGDCKVNFKDLYLFYENWLNTSCRGENDFCNGSDIDRKGQVDLIDYVLFANNWATSLFTRRCGDTDNPRPVGDLDHNCSVDILDLQVFAEEWLNNCDWLNYNCRGADLHRDSITNLNDFSVLSGNLTE